MSTADQLIIPQVVPLEIGPWRGSMRSVLADQVPQGYLASPSQTPALDMLYLPGVNNTGVWKRRGGQTVQFDTLSGGASVTGLLPASWAARCRQIEEFLSDSVSDGIPTICALLTKETMASGLDDGAFANFWWRDRVNSLNRTLCDDYDTTLTYPVPGSTQYYRVIPLWYDSGDGGITRGTTEFLRRFLLSGSRRFQKSGRWWYFPNFRGTPCRDDGVRGSAGTTTLTPNSNVTNTGTQMVDESAGVWDFSDLTTAGDGHWIRAQNDVGTRTITLGLNGTVADNTVYTITYNAKNDLGTPGANTTVQFAIITSAKGRYTSAVITPSTAWTTSFVQYTTTITCNGTSGVNGSLTANSFEYGEVTPSGGTGTYSSLDYIAFSSGTTTAMAHHLIPSGPFPPTHCGTVAGNSAVTEQQTLLDGNGTSVGSWSTTGSITPGTASYTDINEAVTNDATYIRIINADDECRFTLATPSAVPVAGDTVTVRFRAYSIVGSGFNTLHAYLRYGAGAGTTIRSTDVTWYSTSSVAAYAFTLTDTEIATVTAADSTWATVQLAFSVSSVGSGDTVLVTQAYLGVLPAAASSEGGWKGKDSFLRAFYYRFEDGSIWALTTPRFPNSTLSNGLELITVDSANPEVAYSAITHSNIPVPPAGVVKVGLCRTTKIDSTLDDNLVLNPHDFRLIAEVDAGTTSYVDYGGDDFSLGLDVTGLFIRYNHMMPPASRYLAAGDMRAAASYGKSNPCAITIAPVGRTTDYDLNLADTSSSLYAQDSSYMRLALSSGGVMTLTLLNDTGSATAPITFASDSSGTFPNCTTLQALVDAINSTSCAVNNQQWRAQILPDVSPDAAMTSLCPHTRDIASVTTTNGAATLTKASGGLGKVAVGAFITAAGVTAGTYVTRIDSDTQLTMSANASASAAVTVTFYFRLGDDPTSLSNTGYQRVLGNCLPGFLYFTKTYLATFLTEKSTTWMTVATPGSVKSAPNAWANTEANRFEPPLEAGIAQGIAAVDHGFVVPYASKIGAIRPRGPDLVQDKDYSLVIINEDHGCCAWNTVTAGNRFATFLSPAGLGAADLRQAIRFSEDIYAPPTSGVGVVGTLLGTGDFGYEIAASTAATGQDNDSSYASVRVIHSIVWVCYRASSSSSTAANRMLGYDFSAGHETNGLKALDRSDGTRWGWSLPLSRTISVVGFGRRDDGGHLYGWNDANAGTGAGRIDELETGDTDNGTAISTGTASLPWIKAEEGEDIVVHRVILEHNSPSGSTGSLVWHRGYSNDAYSLTPGTSTLDLLSELIQISMPGRTPCTAGYFEYTQATGTAREWRKIKVFVERRRRMR